MLYPCALLCLLFTLAKCSETLDCANQDSARTTSMKLKLKLLCNYDKSIRPVIHHTNKTTVRLIMAPRVVNFDDQHSTLFLKIWLSMNWKDYHLSWDKKEFDNIDQFNVDSNMIWIPDLTVYNTKNDVSLEEEVAPAVVDYQGDVHTFMTPELAGHCVPNWANWPYDIHVCTIILGSKRYLGSTVDFQLMNKDGLLMNYLLPNKDWEILNTNTIRNETKLQAGNETDTVYVVSVNYKFTLRRHASVYVASYLIPGVVMVILSLGILWIPPDKTERTAILCTLVILQSLFLQYIAYEIPSNGDKTPYLVCFYRDCLALTGVLVIETFVTRSMLTWNSRPTYLQNTFELVASNKVLQFIFTNDLDPKSAAKMMEVGNDEGSTLVTGNKDIQQWQMFVGIINKAFFILLIPIYLLLSVSLLPLNYSFSPN